MLDAAAVATVADAADSTPASDVPAFRDSSAPAPEAAAPQHDAAAALAAATAPSDAPQGRTLTIIDSRVDDAAGLAARIGGASDVLMLDAAQSGIAAVAEHLGGGGDEGGNGGGGDGGGYDTVRIFSHGSPGGFALGADSVDAAALSDPRVAQGLGAWQAGLSADADILIYGCDVAGDERGAALIGGVASLTGADVAASDDPTGAAALGGDWALEVRHGAIEAQADLDPALMRGWQGLLAAPAIDDGESDTRQVAEDGTMTVTNLSLAGSDTLTVTLTLTEDGSAPAGGTFSLAQTTGLSFATGDGSNDATMVFDGSAADVNAALDGLTYTPTADFNGDAQLAVQVSNTDGNASQNVALAVVPANDAPDLTPPAIGDAATATVDEGTGNTVTLTPEHFGIDATTAATLGGFDPDLDPALSTVSQQTTDQLTFEVTALPSEGRLELSGNPLAVGSLFTLQDLIGNNLVYEHRGAQANDALNPGSEADSFGVTIRDGATGIDTGTVNVEINPVNQAPTVSAQATVTPYEGRQGVPIQISVSDPDQVSTSWTVTFDSLDLQGGTLYLENGGNDVYDAGTDTEITNGYSFTGTLADLNNRLRLDVSADEPTAAITFDVSATDDDGGTNDAGTTAGDGLTTTQTITLEQRENNDHPVLDTNTGTDPAAPVTGATGANTIALTGAMLGVTDPDSPDRTLTYTLTQAVANLAGGGSAQVQLDGDALGLGGSFTQADVEAGDVTLVYTGGGTGPQHDFNFGFRVRDGEVTAFSTVRQVVDRLEGGTRNDADTAFLDQTNSTGLTNGNLLHQFHFRFDAPTGPGTSATEVTNTGPSVGTIVGITPSELTEEGAPVTIGTNGAPGPRIEITDPDNSFDEITIRLENTPTGGTLLLNGTELSVFDSFTQQDLADGNVTYRHDGGEQFLSANLGFAFSVSDGTANVTPTVDGDDNNFTVEATPVNDTPSTAANGSGLVVEGGTLTFNTPGQPAISLSDVDGSGDAAPGALDTHESQTGVDELFVTLTSAPSHGTLLYNGTAVNAGDTLLKSEVESNLFTYVHDGSENFDDSFDLQVNDAQGFGAASAPDNDSVGNAITVAIDIAPLNDDPLVDSSTPTAPVDAGTLNTGLRVAEGATGVIGGSNAGLAGIGTAFSGNTDCETVARLLANDPDNSATQIQYRITQNVSEGELRLNGRVIGLNSTFTQNDLDNGNLTYRHLGGESAGIGAVTDSFDFEVGDAGPGTYPTGTFDIEVFPTANDAPTVTVPSGPVAIDDTAAGSNPIAGISVGDPDLPGGTDELQVTVRLTQADGTPLTAGQYAGYTLSSSTPGSVTVDTTHDGNGDFLELRSTVAEINTYLGGLQMGSSTDADESLRLEVIADDRLRDGTGALDATGDDANGGEDNQNPTGGGAPVGVPGGVFDAYSDTVSAHPADGLNLAADTVELRVSTEDDLPTISDPGAQTVDEDITTTISGLSVTDPESTAFGIDVEVTLSVPDGTIGVGSQSGVSVAGNNSGSVTLTGAATDIDSLLAAGVTYTSASNDNLDNNAGDAGDTTLTVSLVEGTAAIGNEAGGTPGDDTVTREIPITVTPVNDAPTVSQSGGALAIADPNTPQAITGFGVGDIDISGDPGNLSAGESDFVQVTVRLLDDNDDPLASGAYTGATLDIDGSVAEGSGFEIDDTLNGVAAALQLRGTLANVDTALSNLRLTLGTGLGNADTPYSVQVVVDDRVRVLSTGALDASGIDANGGEQNNSDGSNSVQAVPTTAFDPYADAVPNIFNMDAASREVWPSSANEAPSVGKATAEAVDEDTRTRVGGDFTVADTESENFDLDVQVTLSVPSGTLSLAGTGDQSGSTVAGVAIAGDETGSLTLTGHADAIEALLNDATNGLFYTPPAHDNADRNAGDAGDVTVTVEIDELDAATTFGVARQTASTTFAITVNPVNDAPVLGGTTEDGSTVRALYRDLDASGNFTGNWHLTTGADDPDDGTDAASLSPIALLTGGATVSDVDLDAALNDTGADSFGGGTVTVSMTGGYFTGDQLAANGALPGVASVSGGSAGDLVVSLSDDATAAQVAAIVNSLTFDNDGDPTDNGTAFNRAFSIVLNDGNNNNDGGASDGINDAGGPTALNSTALTGTLSFVRLQPPTATDNANTADAGTPTVSGDLRTDDDGSGTDSDPDAADTLLTVVRADTGAAIAGGGSAVPAGPGGVTLTGSYGSVTIQQDGSYSYTLDTSTPAYAALGPGDTVTDTFAYRIADQDGQSDDATLTITITGDADLPTATDNARTMANDDPTVSGNLRDDGTPDSDVEDPTADLVVSAVAGAPGNVGAPVAGSYGSITVAANGAYTYTLDTALPAVANLGPNQSLTETFTYTIQDTDGGTDTATLTITIDGPAAAPATPGPTPPAGPSPAGPPAGPATVGGTSGGAGAPVFDNANLQDRRADAVPFAALGDIDNYRNPLFSPVELNVQLQDRVLAEGVQSFAIPSTAFRHTDPAEQLTVEATLNDGSALPSYMTFDSESGVFTVNTDVPREAGIEGVTVRVVGRDSAGNEASTSFYVTFAETDRSQQVLPGDAGTDEGEGQEDTPTDGAPDEGDGGDGDDGGDAGDGGDGEGAEPTGADQEAALTPSPDRVATVGAEGDDRTTVDGRPTTREQIETVGRQAAMTARDQLLDDLMAVFRHVA